MRARADSLADQCEKRHIANNKTWLVLSFHLPLLSNNDPSIVSPAAHPHLLVLVGTARYLTYVPSRHTTTVPRLSPFISRPCLEVTTDINAGKRIVWSAAVMSHSTVGFFPVGLLRTPSASVIRYTKGDRGQKQNPPKRLLFPNCERTFEDLSTIRYRLQLLQTFVQGA